VKKYIVGPHTELQLWRSSEYKQREVENLMGIVRKCAQKLSEKLNGENWVGGHFGRKHGRATRSSRYPRDIAN
jgi:hypothetical protein